MTVPPQPRKSPHAEVPHPLGVRDLSRDRLSIFREGFDAGRPGTEMRAAHHDLVMSRLREHWESHTSFSEGVALAAVGSLGRGDAGPFSDLDLVLLHDGSTLKKDELAELAPALWYPIWDAGLDLDHSTRSLTECRQVASKDLSAAAGLLDIVPVAGDESLVAAARSAIYADWRAAARKRLPELLTASRQRAERFGRLAYLIEPNIKEAKGGLRDYGSLSALAATWLTDRPHGAVDRAAEHLEDVRDAIQVVSGRHQLLLGRHLVAQVASLLGYDAADDLLASVAQSGREIGFALDTTERRARRSLERSGIGSRAWRARRLGQAPRHVSVGEGLIDVDGDIALAPHYDVSRDPLITVRAAATAASKGLNFTPELLATLQKAPDIPEPWPAEARKLFRELLRSSGSLVSVWEAIDLHGIAVRWIPEWEGVRNRPQHSPVHQYTVDRHMLEATVNAAKKKRQVRSPDLLTMTALLHDIGKRPGATDHSVDGAALIPVIGERLGLSARTRHDMHLLVLHHLLLADLATKEDPKDPATAKRLLDALENRRDMLDLLRALTEADARAAGPKAWTQWRESLVDTLYRTAGGVLDAG